MNAPSVKCTEIHKSFGEGELRFEVLHGINLEVQKGELLMLMGPSGSGKTTLLSIMTALLTQDGGSCALFGKPLETLSEKERAEVRKKEIGYVFQTLNLIPTLSSAENVAIPLLLNGWEKKKALLAAKERLEQLGLGERLASLPAKLSGGEQQRVAIARALIHNPPLIVCDEPTSSLDHANGERILSELQSIAKKEQRTLIIITHDSRILSFADRIAYLEDGRLSFK